MEQGFEWAASAAPRPRRAHVVTAPIAGGVVRHVLDLVRFDPLGAPSVVLPPWPGLDAVAHEFSLAGAPVLRLRPGAAARDPDRPRPDRPPTHAVDWLATRPVDLAHVHYANSHDGTAAVAAALACGAIAISTDHACAPAVATDAWEPRRRVARRQAALLADSSAIAVPLSARLDVPVLVALHGIDTRRFAALPDRASARRALQLPETARVIASVGALFSSKGMHHLVEAIAALQAREDAETSSCLVGQRGRVVLVMAGEGPERPRLVTLAGERRVDLRLLGWLEDVRPLLAASDVFALASASEGLPTAVLEAMAAGLPVVATRCDGVAEALGGYGCLVPPGQPPALAAALARALAGHLRSHIHPARERVRRHFEVRRLAAEIAALHAQLWIRSRSGIRD